MFSGGFRVILAEHIRACIARIALLMSDLPQICV